MKTQANFKPDSMLVFRRLTSIRERFTFVLTSQAKKGL
jgi:hypothetical protein